MTQRYLCFILLAFASRNAFATVTLLDKDQWKFSAAGFVELDTIVDSTRSFTEAIGNNPVARSETVAGQDGRTQMSIRNSRLSFTIEPPPSETWATKGFFEFDLLGYDPSPGASNTEAGFFDNPTFRVRHAYLAAESRTKWTYQLLAGQTWMILGWQPYYFLPTVDVHPVPAMLYSRNPQMRGTVKIPLTEKTYTQFAAGIMRPPQRDALYPAVEAGARLAFGGRTSGFTGGSSGPQGAQPMSIAVSSTVRQFAIPTQGGASTDTTNYTGYAVAVDAMIPVLASSDGVDVSNTLSLTGEFTTGQGYGDQFGGWTGNLANPLSQAVAGSTAATINATRPINLDGGEGDFDVAGNFHLVELETWNASLQYHFNAVTKTWISGGYAQLFSNNISGLTAPNGLSSAGLVPYMKDEIAFGNIFHDLTKNIRIGLEYAFVVTDYADGEVTHNNRYQLSTWFIF